MKVNRTQVVDASDQMCGAPEEHEYCLRCGRKLKTLENRERGYGNVCYRKLLTDNNRKRLF